MEYNIIMIELEIWSTPSMSYMCMYRRLPMIVNPGLYIENSNVNNCSRGPKFPLRQVFKKTGSTSDFNHLSTMILICLIKY